MLTQNETRVTKILPVSEAIADDLAYWIKRGTYGNVYDGKHWIRNTQKAWAEHLGYSLSNTKRGIKELTDMGIIEARCFSWNNNTSKKAPLIRNNQINSKVDEILDKSLISIEIMLPSAQENIFNRQKQRGLVIC